MKLVTNIDEVTILNKVYDGESLYDLERDVSESLQAIYNPEIDEIPVDEHGFQLGKFIVSITWQKE